MTEALFLGFLIGMRHALEADHVAAVASIASGERSVRRIVRHGAVWGVGHTLTLMLFGATVLLLGTAVPEALAQWLEFAVGVMLVVLGGWVLHRLIRDRIHFHTHRHRDGLVHLHAHSHGGETSPHDRDRHDHAHSRGLPLRTLFVGMMHGMAGTAALLLVSAASLKPVALGLVYIAVFGVGSIGGMAVLSAVIAVPLSYSARLLTWGQRTLQTAVGGVTMALGAFVIYDSVAAGLLGPA